MDWSDIGNFVDKAGVVGVLILVIAGFVKKWWVLGWTYRECQDREHEWKRLALAGTRIAEHFVGIRTSDEEA